MGGVEGSREYAERIQLDTIDNCERELTRTTNGLAYLDHAYNDAVDMFDLAEATWEVWEAKAAEACGEKGQTATELRGRMTTWTGNNMDAADAAAHLRDARSHLRKIERYFRSLEKRASNAQSALKRHTGEGKYGGSVT